MEMHQVRYFLALCDTLNFTRAAEHCGVSQPTLSNAIKRLEQELGGSLFQRTPRRVTVSPLGSTVRPYLLKLERCAQDACRVAADFKAAPARAHRMNGKNGARADRLDREPLG